MSNPVIIGDCELWLGDCREILPSLGKVDAVVTDPPYGVTRNSWDCAMTFGELWSVIWSVARDDSPVVMTAVQPFTSSLICSQIHSFRYSWVWQKSRPSGHLNAKKRPLREHEDVCVFYQKQPTYNPQYKVGKPNHVGPTPRRPASENYGEQHEIVEQVTDRKYPKSILRFDSISPTHVEHPTQKPVDLIEYMVRTYSDCRETILDPFMGSGTTGVACVKLGRKFIGIEIEEKYFDIAVRRIEDAVSRPSFPLTG